MYSMCVQSPDLFLRSCKEAGQNLDTLCKGEAFKLLIMFSTFLPSEVKSSRDVMRVDFISTIRTTAGNECITKGSPFYYIKRDFDKRITLLDACMLSCKDNVLNCLTEESVPNCVMMSTMYPQGVFMLNDIVYVVSTVVFPDIVKMPDFKLNDGCTLTPFCDLKITNELDQIIRNSFVEVK